MTTFERAESHFAKKGFEVGYIRRQRGRVIVGAHRGYYGQPGCRYIVATSRGNSFHTIAEPNSYHSYNNAILREVRRDDD